MKRELDVYRGREQSFIKHLFLKHYLQAAGYKTLQGRSPTFNFVDAFAGPWRVSDDANYSDASFDQALQTLEDVRANLGKTGVAGLKIRFCLCEKRAEAVAELRRYAKRKASFEIHVIHGSFEDNLDRIAGICRDGFTFTFIDPTGWDIRSEPVLEFLRRQNGEFLLNFMAEHVNRHAEYSKVAASFGRFLADPDWAVDFDALPTDWNNEKRILFILKSKMKDARAARYLPDFAIRKPRENRVKMRLVLGTHSIRGLEVFRDVQAKVERAEIEMNNKLRDPNDRRPSLFSEDEIVDMQQDLAGVGCPRFQREAEERVKKLLVEGISVAFNEIAACVLEEVPMRVTEVRLLLVEMKKLGIVAFDLPPRRRVPQPETRISLSAQTT